MHRLEPDVVPGQVVRIIEPDIHPGGTARAAGTSDFSVLLFLAGEKTDLVRLCRETRKLLMRWGLLAPVASGFSSWAAPSLGVSGSDRPPVTERRVRIARINPAAKGPRSESENRTDRKCSIAAALTRRGGPSRPA